MSAPAGRDPTTKETFVPVRDYRYPHTQKR